MTAKGKYGKKIDLALNTWIKLARAYSVFQHKADDDIRSQGLTTPQFGVIEALGHLGPLRVGVLCDKMLISGGNMTLVLDNLEKRGLIKRDFSKDDRRAIVVQLTETGTRVFNEAFPSHAEKIGELFSVLTQDEQKQLGTLLKKLGLALSAKGSKIFDIYLKYKYNYIVIYERGKKYVTAS
jgi:MarR family 2-MHQ and catechol resistance regulon transcriptional repressor